MNGYSTPRIRPVVVALVLAVVATASLVACASGSAPAAITPAATVTVTPIPAPSTSMKTVEVPVVVKTKVKTVAAPPPKVRTVIVQQVPAGPTHNCKVLLAEGYSWNSMINYWYDLGSPSDMDNDHNGWPCETVYGPYWNHV